MSTKLLNLFLDRREKKQRSLNLENIGDNQSIVSSGSPGIILYKNVSPDNHDFEKNVVQGRLLHAKRQILSE